MATTTSITTTYAGDMSKEYISALVYAMDSISGRFVTLKSNVKGKQLVRVANILPIAGDASCSFNPQGSVNVTERFVDPKRIQYDLELCILDYVDDWNQALTGPSADDNLPSDFEAYFKQRVLAKIAEAENFKIWNGVDGVGSYDGLEAKMIADANVIKVATPVAITEANVVAELTKMFKTIPVLVRRASDFKWVVSQNIADAYALALGAGNYLQQLTTGDKPLNFNGIALEVCDGISDNTMSAYSVENIWFATATESDFNDLRMIDMRETTGDKTVRFSLTFSADVNFGIPEEVVFYQPA